MRKYIVIAVILVAVGVGVSLMVLPSKEEAALLQQKSVAQTQMITSPDMAAANVDFEAEYAAGKRTLPIITGLADKRVSEGNRPAAIALLEEYVTANPTDVAGRKKLAEQYQLAGDGVKYNEQLEAIAAAEPTEANLKMLSDVYNSGQLYAKQIETLKKLVEITQSQKPEYMADLATILVVEQRRDEALVVIQDIKTKHPTFRSYAITRIEAGALVEAGKGEEAYQLAEQWVSGSTVTAEGTTLNANAIATSNKELADLADILHYGGYPELAIKLIEPRVSQIATSVELATAYVNANITVGNTDRAFEILTQIYNAGTMSAGLYRPFIDLSLQREDTATVETVVANLKPEIFTEEQAINLIETPSVQNNPAIAQSIANVFDKPEYLTNKPVLAAVVALSKNAPDQDDKIATALQSQLTSTMRVRLAQACYRASKEVCIDEVVKGFPTLSTMTRPQVDEYADLHIAIKRADSIVDAVGAEVAAGKAELTPAHVRLAAAAGKTDVVDAWLLANGNTASIKTLQQLYYAANDNDRAATASAVATKLYERDPSPMNREIIVASYIRAGEYDKALPLVRENLGKTPGANDQYLTVLTKVARSDAAARKELNEYALSVLTTSEDNKAQIAAAYTLLNNGQRSVVMPYIKTNAETRGGEWAVMWRQLNAATRTAARPAAPVKLSPEQMLRIAQDPRSSEATKRQMAFNLISEGRRAEAASIFQALAANKGPDDQNVKDLLYLWGPKLNSDQIGWITARGKAATNSYEKAKWNEYVNTYGDDNAVVQYVSSSPDALYNPDLRKKYFRSLASYGSREAYDTNMRQWVAGTTDVEALRDYAETAQSFGYKEAAVNAFRRIEQINPSDEKTLKTLGALSYAKGSYKASENYINRYEQVIAQKGSAETDPQEAYFYKAQLLRRNGDIAAAKQEFQKVVQASGNEASLAPDARSRLYTSYFHMGDHERGKQGFRTLLAQYPDDKGVLADYMSVLIEYRYTDEATAIANQYDKNSPYYGGGQSMMINSPNVSSIESISNGREMRISFNKPIEGKAPVAEKEYAWAEAPRAGYDSMVVSAKHGYVLKFMPTSDNSMQVVPVAQQSISPQAEMQREQDLRLQLLYAQIESQNGQHEAAERRIAALQQYYPNNPQLLTYAASLQSAAGNSSDAIRLLDQAQSLSPENEDIAAIRGGIGRQAVNNFIKADYENRAIGDNSEHIGTLSGAARVADNVEVGFNLQRDWMDTENIRRGFDGLIGDYKTERDRGELYAAWLMDGGARLQSSLYANNDSVGAGLSYDFNNDFGRTGLFGEYHRPYWDFVEAVYEHTTRDRVGARHYAQINPSLSMGLETSLNRYNTKEDDDVAKSGLFRLSLVQRLQEQGVNQPYLGIGYGFDGEYMIGDQTLRNTAVSGGDYKLLPIRTREVHVLTGILQHDLTESTHVNLVGGWAYDRFGGNGPLVEGRLTQDVTENVEAGVRARYGLDRNSGNSDSATNVGAHLMYKF